jgi:Fe-S-cluster containining protein
MIPPELTDATRKTLSLLDELAEPLQAEYRPWMACQKGCSGCCMDGFKIRYAEALLLFQGFLTLPPEEQALVLNQVNASSESRQGKCPLLVDGACSLYAWRPALCRAYGLLVKLNDNISSCSLNFQDIPREVGLKTFDIGLFYDTLHELSVYLWQVDHGPGQDPPFQTITQFFQDMSNPAPQLV